MTEATIIVPEGEEGDEALKRLIPNLHKMARGKEHADDE